MKRPPESRADVLVVGGGVAALRTAIAAAEAGARVALLCKGRAAASGCSAQIERGIEYCAVNCGAYTERQQELLADEYLRCGMGINRRDVVEAFVAALPAEHRRLMRLALPLMETRPAASRLRWLGHRLRGGLIGGRGFSRALLRALRRQAQELGVSILDRCQVVALDSDGGCVRGAVALDLRLGGLYRFGAPSVVLATGGAGGVFPLTTNPTEVVGDGPVLAGRSGALLRNMEFYSYYPLSVGRVRRIYLIQPVLMEGRMSDSRDASWSANGAGAEQARELLLRVRDACRWMEERGRAGCASPAGGVWWDGRRLSEASYRERIPLTYGQLRHAGIDLTRDRLEVAPHAHQSIGGVEVDARGASSVTGLFAAGESAAGLHGALRMNGTGVTAGLALGAIAGRSAAEHALRSGRLPGRVNGSVPAGKTPASAAHLRGLRDRIRSAMGPVLVIRRREDLARAAAILAGVREEVETIRFEPRQPALAGLREEVRIASEAASIMVEHSLLRGESLGFFQTC
jgi:succinate dehydrogenase/fumarate reductase flavoprotein subunit